MKEFSRLEKAIMDPSYMRRMKLFLICGIMMNIIGIGIFMYGVMNTIPYAKTTFAQMTADVKSIPTNSTKESALKDWLLRYANKTEMLICQLAWSRMLLPMSIFLIVGGGMIGIYFRDKQYHKLIDKLRRDDV